MAEAEEDAVAAAARLEAALERLARASAARPKPAEAARPDPRMQQRTQEVAERIDALIAQLRGVLSGTGAE